jgi:hypothetical protein
MTQGDQSGKLFKILVHSLSVCAFTCEIPLWYTNSNEELMVVDHNDIILFLHMFFRVQFKVLIVV